MPNNNEAFHPDKQLTPEEITRVTGFVAICEFSEFVKPEGFLSPEFHEEMDRITAVYGEQNVVSSFFQEKGEVKFGIFIKRS
jgi:hypothetical protein